MVIDDHVVLHHQDLEKPGWPQAGAVPQQGSTRVQTKLIRNPVGNERPGGMDMAAAVQVRADRGQPAGQRFGVDEVLADQVLTIRRWDLYRIMAGDDQPPDRSARPGNELSGQLQLRLR